MKKTDYLLIFVLVIVALFFIIINQKNVGTTAAVYYDSKEVLRFSLSEDNTYTVLGDLGDVVIEVKNNKVRIIEETSPNNICSKMGYIENSGESLVCLPNKIVVTIIGDIIDAVIR